MTLDIYKINEAYQEISPGVVKWIEDEPEEDTSIEFWMCIVSYHFTGSTVPQWRAGRVLSTSTEIVKQEVSRYNDTYNGGKVSVLVHMPLIFMAPSELYLKKRTPEYLDGLLILCIFRESIGWFESASQFKKDGATLNDCRLQLVDQSLHDILLSWRSDPATIRRAAVI